MRREQSIKEKPVNGGIQKEEKSGKTKKRLRMAGLLLLAAAVLALTAAFLPWLWRIGDLQSEESRAALIAFRSYTDRIGIWKYPLMLFLQVAQIVVAIIPGGPMQILMGFVFGTWQGLILSLLGALLATWLIIFGVRRWGVRFAGLFVKKEKLEKLSHLGSPRKRDALLFLLFLIPGTPKDVLTYFAPLSGVDTVLLTFMVTIARIPALLSSVYIGATLSEGNFAMSLLFFALTAVLGIGGILVYEKIIEKKREGKDEKGSSVPEKSEDSEIKGENVK